MKKQKKNFFVEKLNQLSIGKKLLMMQIFCVILPLLVTDSAILGMMVHAEKRADMQEMESTADSVKYTLGDSIESAVSVVQSIYSNRYVNEFMEQRFFGPLDYYKKNLDFMKDSLYTISINSNLNNVIVYAANKGIVNGGYFKQVDEVKNEVWYQNLMSQKTSAVFAYVEYEKVTWQKQRNIYLVRRMDYYHRGSGSAAIKLELDYNRLLRSLTNANYSSVIYICDGDRVILSNDGRGGPYVDFEQMDEQNKNRAGIHTTMNVYGRIWDLYVMPPQREYLKSVLKNWPAILLIVLLNLVLPFALMNLINLSFTRRLKLLDDVFVNVGKDELYPLPEVSGRDEISELMKSYNSMANKINELIEKEYKSRLKQQEVDIARQKAELLALHSQINPHFLFNALESIRMHSVIKKEYETADMVEKLALMQRQNVEWNDAVQIKEEIRFIEAYLELQKYRFGDRLNYEIHVAPECEGYRIPKLTLVTFAENACVHGIENKSSPGWVFVRVTRDEKNLILEVEDTGNGMEEEVCQRLLQGMRQANIELLQENRRVGIYNAALRLRMFSGEHVHFDMESEIGVGTLVMIVIPLSAAEKMGS